MIGSLLAVFAFTTAFALVGPVIARRVSPVLATRMLVPGSILTAIASTFALAVAAFTLIGQFPEIAEMGPWSPAALHADTPIPTAGAIAGGLLLTYTAVSAVVLVSRRSLAFVEIHRTCGRLGSPGSLVVLESDKPDAFTTPEATGRIVVTRGMLDALTQTERGALLAHEASHLRHRHAWWLLAADLSAAINPTLRPTARALRRTTERWADEDAANAIADRRTVAHALARAALAAHDHHSNRPAPITAATGGNVPERVAALLAPARRRTRPTVTALALALLLLAGTADASLHLQRHGETLFEHVMTGNIQPTHTVQTAHADLAPPNIRTQSR
jgi:Zn-dependent protease with chaperone function